MELTIHFLFNLSLIIVLLFFGILWVDKAKSLASIQVTAVIFFIACLILCFIFSYRIEGESVLFDLRKIPFIVGGLYFGLGPLLATLTIVIRALLGIDSGFWMTSFFYGGFALLFWRIRPWFIKQSPQQRVFFSVGLAFIFSLMQSYPMGFTNMPYFVFDIWFAYLFIQPLGVGMIAYFIEVITKVIQLRQQVVDSKRFEAVEQMGAAISHEIRNPLTAAMGFVQLFRMQPFQEKNILNISP